MTADSTQHTAHRWTLPSPISIGLALPVDTTDTSSVVRSTSSARGWLALPPLLAFAMSAFAIGIPSFWIDEFATITASARSTADLWAMLGNVDAVHGLYYLSIQPLVSLFGPSEIALRMPSAVFIGIAAAGVTALGFRLRGYGLALAGGFSFAILPITSHYGMEARTPALTAALAVWTTYCLVRAIDVERAPRTWWVLYAALMILAIWVFAFTVLLLLAHAATLAFTGPPRRWVGFAWSAGSVVVACVPLVFLISGQSAQVDWIEPLSSETAKSALASWTSVSGGRSTLGRASAGGLVVALWIVVATGLWSTVGGRPSSPRARRFMSVVIPWLVLPTAVLLGVSLASPLFVPRYVFLSAPAFALLVGYGLITFRRRWMTVAVTFMLVILAVPSFVADRQETSKSGLRPLVEVLEAEALLGDAILFEFPNQRAVMDTYPEVFSQLNDLAMKESGLDAANLFGEAVPSQKLRERMAEVERIWVVLRFDESSIPPWQTKELEDNFTLTQTWQFHRVPLWLFTRDPTPIDSD